MSSFESISEIQRTSTWSLARARRKDTGQLGWLQHLSGGLPKEVYSQFEGAAKIGKALSLPGLAQVLEVGQEAGVPYVFYGIEPGQKTLRGYLVEHGPLGRKSYPLIQSLAELLLDFHKRLGHHLCLSPDTVFIHEAADGSPRATFFLCETVQVLRDPLGSSPTRLGQVQSPPEELNLFLAPEQYGTKKTSLAKADVYALGSLLYQTVTGQPPSSPTSAEVTGSVSGVHCDLLPHINYVIGTLRSGIIEQRPDIYGAIEYLNWLMAIDRLMNDEVKELENRYVYQAPIKPGSMGVLFVLKAVANQHDFAIKIPLPGMPSHRSDSEIECSQRAHKAAPEAVVAVEEWGQLDGHTRYFTMKYVQGLLLGDFLKQLKDSSKTVSEKETAHIGLLIAQPMAKVHAEKIVHRDLKPANLMLVYEGKKVERVKILDFGIAANLASRDRKTVAGEMVGTRAWAAPEQFGNAREADEKCDVFALGRILQALLTGECEQPGQIKEKACSAAMHSLLSDMTELNPEDRPSMLSVAARLRQILVPVVRESQITPVLLITGSVVLLCLILTYAFLGWMKLQSNNP